MFDTSRVAMRSTMLWLAVAGIFLSLALPILSGTSVQAAQILDRYIDMGTSAVSTETSYDVSFQLPNGAQVGSVRVEFCIEDPLPGQACNVSTSEGTNVPSLDADTGSAITVTNIAFDDTPGSTTNTAATCVAPGLGTTHGAGSNLTYFDISCDTADGAGDLSETVVGGGGGTDTDFLSFTVNNIDNPSATGQFYARIYTYAEDGRVGDTNNPMATYVAAGNTLGNYEGGIALSTADVITVEARVQERLSFAVGADAPGDDCASLSGTTIDLGVLDGTDANINQASLDGIGGSNLDLICTTVTTNAANGVTISYLATDMAVSGAACIGTYADQDIDTNNVQTDQCINYDASPAAAFTQGDESWGIGVASFVTTDTSNLQMEATATEYDRTGGWTDEYAVDPSSTTAIPLIDSAGTVASGEAAEIDVGGEAAVTTPTGYYTATLTFIATGTF